MIDIRSYLKERATFIEGALDEALPADGTAVVEAMRYSLLGGGKRIRPILLLAAGDTVGCDSDLLVPYACGVEMIHTYSLIHDDLPAMDDDELRRGRPASHVRYGDALAILAGDALLTEAFSSMAVAATSHPDLSVAIAAIREIALASGARGMVGGQADDIAAEGTDADLAAVESIHARKTGALLRASVRAGGILAGASDEVVGCLTRYAGNLGLAFQVVDDVLDATASSETTGKAEGRDEVRGKRTYTAILGVEGAVQRAVELRDVALGSVQSLGAAADPLRGIAEFVVGRVARASR